MAAPGTRSARNLVDVRPTGLARDLPASYAKTAFEDNFSDYLRRVRRMPNPDRFALYSVPEAMAERFGSLVLPVDQELVFDPEPRLQPNIATIHADDIPRLRQLTNAVLDTYRTLNYMEPSAAALSEFSTLSANNSVTDAYRGSATFDLPTWISLNPELDLPDRRAIVGASYLRRNFDTLAKLIDDLPKPTGAVEVSPAKEIVWYRPGGTAWGCSPDLRDAIRSMKASIRRKFGRTSIRTTLVFPEISRGRDFPRRFEGLFGAGYIAPAGVLDPAVEVIHIPGVACLMLVDVALSQTVHIPVGFASTAAEPRERIVSKLASLHARFDELWRQEQREDDEPTGMEPEEDAHEE